jgi:hypothetical protein
VPEALEHFPSHQDNAPTGETRQPQDQLYITGIEDMAKTGIQGVIFQSQKTFTSSQDTRTRDAQESMVNISSHKQIPEQMTFPKEVNGSYQDPGYNNAPEAMVQFGQTSHPSQYLAIILFAQDARNQDAPEAVPKIDGRTMTDEPVCTMSQNKAVEIGDRESIIRKDSDATMHQEVCAKDTDCDISASKLSEYGVNNLLLPPLVDPLQRPSTPVRVGELMGEAPETPNTGNFIQPLVNNYVPPQVTQLITFDRFRLTQYDPLSKFNS